MNILSAENVSKSYGEKTLLDRISFGIAEGDRIGLIGVNGAGKSTLLKLVAGIENPEAGSLIRGSGVTFHYLPQEPVFNLESRVLQQVFQGDAPVLRLLRQYEETLDLLEKSPESRAFSARLFQLQTQLDTLDAWQLEHDAKAILTRLGIVDFEAVVGQMSGGQRKRIALAQALIQSSTLLILDEPTNHIDDESVEWLEGYLRKRKGALLMVTHDRYFLDRVVNHIFELDGGQLYHYPGNYDAFLTAKRAREAEQRATEEKRQNFLRNEVEWIKRGPKARGTKQKARTERYYEVLERTSGETSTVLELSFAKTRLGKSVIRIDHVSKGYVDRRVIEGFSYIVSRTDRIGIIGPNGSGKSTLLKLMAGRLIPDKGTVEIGTTVKIGYFSQEYEDLDGSLRALEYIRETAEFIETSDGQRVTASQMMERFLFPGSLQWTAIAKLSGGERRRLVLLRVLMEAPNVLLLDEPTNDLDISTLNVLEDYLDDFPGAVIVVSHDRYFLDRVVEKVFVLSGHGDISQYLGNFSDYLKKRPERDEAVQRLAVQSTGGRRAIESHTAGIKSREELGDGPERLMPRFTFKEQKEFAEIDEKIAAAEQALRDIDEQMKAAASDYTRLQLLYDQQLKLESQLDEMLERWAYLNEIDEAIVRSRE